jgi:signal transduction histidine kinase
VSDESPFAGIEHDLRSSLTVISGFAEVLVLGADEATQLDAAKRILAASGRLSDQLDDLFERLELQQALDAPPTASDEN